MNTRSCHHAVWICVGIALTLLASSIRGAPPVIDARSAQTSSGLTSKELEKLPQGRNPAAVLNTAPGVTSPPGETAAPPQGHVMIDGLSIPTDYSLSGWYFEPIFGVQTGSVEVTQIGVPIIRDAVIAPLFGGNSGGVINLGLSRNREFRDRLRDDVSNQRISIDLKHGRLTVDPRSLFERESQLERGLTRREMREELNEVYRLVVDTNLRSVQDNPSDTGGFGGIGVGRYVDITSLEPLNLQGSFFYNPERAKSRFQPFLHFGFQFTGASLDFESGPNITAQQRVSTFYTPEFIEHAFDRSPGSLFHTDFLKTEQTFFDLDTYKITGNFGIGVRCRCGLELGVNLQPGIRIDDADWRSIERIYRNGYKQAQFEGSGSDSEVNGYLGLEFKAGYPLGRFGYFRAAIGTQIAGDTPKFTTGTSEVSVSDDPGDNLYGSFSLSIPFENVIGKW